MHRTRGFSLIELLVAVAVLGLLLGIAVPGLNGYRDTLAQQEARTQLITDLRQARQTSVTRHRSVIVAFGNGSSTTNITTYSVHTDLDGDRVKDSNEPRMVRGLPKKVRLASVALSPNDSLIFDTSGLLVPGSSGGRLVISGARGKSDTLAVSAVGMVYDP
jgi:prepilin-type N-terminal cleavage/methylation domain-containing protein